MEHAQIEIALIEKTVAQAVDQVSELNELQLALVGGGNGDVVFA